MAPRPRRADARSALVGRSFSESTLQDAVARGRYESELAGASVAHLDHAEGGAVTTSYRPGRSHHERAEVAEHERLGQDPLEVVIENDLMYEISWLGYDLLSRRERLARIRDGLPPKDGEEATEPQLVENASA